MDLLSWIVEHIASTVRISTSWTDGIHIEPNDRPLPVEHWSSKDIPLVWTPRIRKPQGNTSDLCERILSVFMNGHFRKGPFDLLVPHLDAFRSTIRAAITEHQAIQLVLPSLPFKAQNPLAFPRPLSHVDLGERLLLEQMHDLCASVEAIFPPGLHITLLTDGVVYANVFFDGSRRCEVEQYREHVASLARTAGLTGKVELLDMQWVVDTIPSFSLHLADMTEAIERLETQDDEVALRMQALQRSMLLNIHVEDYTFNSFADAINTQNNTLPASVALRARRTALAYAAFLLTMKRHRVIARRFPDAIRATVHPKPAPQLPLHLVNRHSMAFPYNGVALTSRTTLARTRDLRNATRIVRFTEALSHHTLTEVRLEDNTFFTLLTDD